MAIRTRLEAEVGELASKLKLLIKNPRALSSMVEEKSPWLSRQLLGAASNFAEPFVAGMGLQVQKLGEDVIEVTLPDTWRSRGESGRLHSGALCTLGEFTARLFWEYHLDLRKQDLNLDRLQLKMIGRPQGTVRAIYRVAISEREKILHRLRSDGELETECEIAIYDASGLLIAQVEVVWKIAKQLSLGVANAANKGENKQGDGQEWSK